jgi:hypothetical protein
MQIWNTKSLLLLRESTHARVDSTFADAVIGVTQFGDMDELEFGVFDRAFITLFQLTCGATWVANLPVST